MKYLILSLIIFCFTQVKSQILKLDSSFNTIGVKVILPQNFDADLTSKITLKYRQVGTLDMVNGFEMSRLNYYSMNLEEVYFS